MIWRLAQPAPEAIEEYKKYQAERDRIYLDHGIDKKGMAKFVIDAAEPFIGPVLDLGTGQGLTAIEIASRGHRVITVDISEKELCDAHMNAIAAGVDSRLEFQVVDNRTLPFEDDSFNLVTMVNVLHHLDDPDAALPEISRVLRRGGKLLISDFTETGFSILDGILGEEGRTHKKNTEETVDTISSKLGKYSLKCTIRDSRFHQYLMIAEKR
ncbi:MAG: class I SAM-dependent methyltransferase [Candidatus Krumholzibacteriota bacterium]|nr:class I SAM-dependent methyltransferase [Candidatus Krumholzibacteriota bacterium]